MLEGPALFFGCCCSNLVPKICQRLQHARRLQQTRRLRLFWLDLISGRHLGKKSFPKKIIRHALKFSLAITAKRQRSLQLSTATLKMNLSQILVSRWIQTLKRNNFRISAAEEIPFSLYRLPLREAPPRATHNDPLVKIRFNGMKRWALFWEIDQIDL